MELLLKRSIFLMNDQREVPRPMLMKKVNGTSSFLERLMRLGTPFVIHFGVSTSNRKQKYFIVHVCFGFEIFVSSRN